MAPVTSWMSSFISKCTRRTNWIKFVKKLPGFPPKWSHKVRKHCCFITGLLLLHHGAPSWAEEAFLGKQVSWDQLKSSIHPSSTVSIIICMSIKYIYAIIFIKSFPHVVKMTYNSPNDGFASILAPSYFLLLSLRLQKHVNQKSIQRSPTTQCTGG